MVARDTISGCMLASGMVNVAKVIEGPALQYLEGGGGEGIKKMWITVERREELRDEKKERNMNRSEVI